MRLKREKIKDYLGQEKWAYRIGDTFTESKKRARRLKRLSRVFGEKMFGEKGRHITDKMDYYTDRLKDKNLTPGQRSFAKKRYKQLRDQFFQIDCAISDYEDYRDNPFPFKAKSVVKNFINNKK